MKTLMKSVVLSVLYMSLAALPALAHGGEHQSKTVMGTVAAVDPAHIEISAKDGSHVSVELNAETEYRKGAKAAVITDVKVGQKVVVTYGESEDGHKMAHEVLLPKDKKN